MFQELLQDEKLCALKSANEGLNDMNTLLDFLTMWGMTASISFDLSLARGLDYYTGPIYEVVMVDEMESDQKKSGNTIGVGSVAAGGRYDGNYFYTFDNTEI